ncbi:SigE family RNA polymerase sigma factor [Streptomyces sp. DW26H14]|uniref:SigE family RNA polymerase sigma factor n=1 Tax=Streptomyces sp. DW26H14 TaxID=3435395 RepID=UPI00403DFFE6
MAEVLEFPAIGPLRGVATRPGRRPRAAPTGGGMPVITPVPAGPASVPPPAQPTALPEPGRGRSRAPGTPAAPASPAASPVSARTNAGADDTMAVGTTVDHLTETYQKHYRSLLGLAALLLDDTASCEDVVQEAFIRVHSARSRVREPEKTLAYLRQTVVNLSRSALRRRILGLKLLSKPMPDMASAEEGAYEQLERDALIKAMRGLQRRQREVLVLRYFADMTEAQVAETLGISLGSVKAYGSRGIAALRVAMEATA